jgi:hypothetical protein
MSGAISTSAPAWYPREAGDVDSRGRAGMSDLHTTVWIDAQIREDAYPDSGSIWTSWSNTLDDSTGAARQVIPLLAVASLVVQSASARTRFVPPHLPLRALLRRSRRFCGDGSGLTRPLLADIPEPFPDYRDFRETGNRQRLQENILRLPESFSAFIGI